MTKFINIPIKVWHDGKHVVHSRLFNPAHIVALTPLLNDGSYPAGLLYTADGNNHSIPAESYHEAFVAIMGSEPPAP